MHHYHLVHPEICTSKLDMRPSSSDLEMASSTNIGEEVTSTTDIEDEAPSTTDDGFTVPLFLTPTKTQSSVLPLQPHPTSTIDIETYSFQFLWETSHRPASQPTAPSTLITTRTPYLSTQVPSFVSTAPTFHPALKPSLSPSPSSNSLGAGTVTVITIGAVVATIFSAAMLAFCLHKKNEKRMNAARGTRAQARREVLDVTRPETVP
jgi:hypothetical protein